MMILTVAYNHKDIDQTLRLIRWIGFLSGKNGNDLKAENILLVPSVHLVGHPLQPQVIDAARATFGTCIINSPPSFERGWPDSCNHMFAFSIEYVEREHLGDMLWVEPDCVLLTKDWYRQIGSEWKTVSALGKLFMGGYIPKPYPHMNGNGIYSSNWREIAPNLVRVPRGKTWDMYAAQQMIPHLHNSALFYHIWKPKHWVDLNEIPAEAVIFHQDKTGRLIKQVDAVRFGGECFQGQNDIVDRIKSMSKFFKSINASAPHKAAGLDINFEVCVKVGDHWTGVYKADTEQQIAALQDLCTRKKTITEITEDDYNSLTQKKTKTQSLIPFDVTKIRRIESARGAEANQNVPPVSDLTISDVVKLSKVTPAQPDDTPKRGRRTKIIA